jgi:hypothetical protein
MHFKLGTIFAHIPDKRFTEISLYNEEEAQIG